VLLLGLLSACNGNSDVLVIDDFTSANNEQFVDINAVDFSATANTVKAVMQGKVRLSEKESEELFAFIYKHGLFSLVEVAYPDKEDEFITLKSGMRLQKKDDFYIIGDMLLTEEQIEYFYGDGYSSDKQDEVQLRGAIVNESTYRWPNKTVYYAFQSGMTQQTISNALAAIQYWDTHTNLTFLPKTSSTNDYIEFYNGSGNNSPVGRQGGKQSLSLHVSSSMGNALHEIGHAVGLYHEHCKPNRDQYINIITGNIKSGAMHNFNIVTNQSCLFTTAFDYGSVMLYPSVIADSDFAYNTNDPVMTRKDNSEWTAQRDSLSLTDILTVNVIYY
jgi:hypothetical protein